MTATEWMPVTGLSPRGRGSHVRNCARRTLDRSIPAWAGEPTSTSAASRRTRVYPRVGGGASTLTVRKPPDRGLSPRGRGSPAAGRYPPLWSRSIPAWAGEPTAAPPPSSSSTVYPRVGGGATHASATRVPNSGLSPRGRGSRRVLVLRLADVGSIPAWAGEPEPGDRVLGPRRVYPRVGGGAWSMLFVMISPAGLSPRGRGSQVGRVRDARPGGSIPAWAGEPIVNGITGLPTGVYPRVGGGAGQDWWSEADQRGLSPRGRGSHSVTRTNAPSSGSIPAWAGEPHEGQAGVGKRTVYPRVGGGACERLGVEALVMGLSPRGRGSRGYRPSTPPPPGSIPAWAGEPFQAARPGSASRVYPRVGGGALRVARPEVRDGGLSPRGRGSPKNVAPSSVWTGSIPAWAGEPRWAVRAWSPIRVYPRVGGGALERNGAGWTFGGLSPRGRGSRNGYGDDPGGLGSIPAWAGEPPHSRSPGPGSRVYPRVGGGAVNSHSFLASASGLSPRGRGSRERDRGGERQNGSIPAWAGEPSTCSTWTRRTRVYPRVGGGASMWMSNSSIQEGLSPRGRGSLALARLRERQIRSIPAWAGEPVKVSRQTQHRRVYPRVGGGAANERMLSTIGQGLSPRGRGSRLRPFVPS